MSEKDILGISKFNCKHSLSLPLQTKTHYKGYPAGATGVVQLHCRCAGAAKAILMGHR